MYGSLIKIFVYVMCFCKKKKKKEYCPFYCYQIFKLSNIDIGIIIQYNPGASTKYDDDETKMNA